MKHTGHILFIFLISLIVNGCAYNNYEELYPQTKNNNPCDSSIASTYNLSVKYILSSNCITCHSKNIASGGVVLDTYESVREQAQKGALMGAILHKSGYQPMPPGTSIPQCQIEKIQQWVDANEPQ
ncbi:c-type cytochrome domain-containing protein [Sporocytophaga myxococcoides]|uniref:c-type cytochrome domain-containing protein n=1 Tax=Sporocytophaga myxococcoides TaxID=153721 RepID=UPI0006936E9C|nr:c-type cytochrome domain-containing protein [Sporocytophaga myxococcoides]